MTRTTQFLNQISADPYLDISNRFKEELKKGHIPWYFPKPPDSDHQIILEIPRNPFSGKPYIGINVLLLWLEQKLRGYQSSRWLNLGDIYELGGRVRKGEKPAMIYGFRSMRDKERAGNTYDFSNLLYPSTQERLSGLDVVMSDLVFNVEQFSRLPKEMTQPAQDDNNFWDGLPVTQYQHSRMLQMRRSMGVMLVHSDARHKTYDVLNDEINFVNYDSSVSEVNRHFDFIYGLVLATAHPKRLNRDIVHDDRGYGEDRHKRAFEELVADIATVLICVSMGMNDIQHHYNYSSRWMELLKFDKTAIFKAADQAQLAYQYLNYLADAEIADIY